MDNVTDLPDVDDPALCQVKCTKTWRTSSQYFGFNQHEHRCVCLEHERFVNKSGENSSLCSNCMAANACHEFVDVYKVVNESIDENQTNEDKFCLARNCSTETETPNYSKSKCDRYFKAYCHLRDFQNSQSYIRKFAYLSHFNNHTEFGHRSTKSSFVCKSVDEPNTTDNIRNVSTFVNSEFTDESTSASTTIKIRIDTENITTDTEESTF
ncbi:Hypothetical predicted protein, partial [Mytilus galloprovincialis]